MLTLDHDTGLAEWQPVLDLYTAEVVDEPMVRITGTIGHDSISTPDHRWPVVTDHGREWVTSNTIRIGDRLTLGAPVVDLPTEPKWEDAFVQLVAWYSADGTQIGTTPQVRIGKSHKENPEKVADLRSVFTALFGPAYIGPMPKKGLPRSGDPVPRWKEDVQARGMTLFCPNKAATARLLEVVPGKDKIVPLSFVNSLTRSQLRLFIDTFMEADGDDPLGRAIGQAVPERLDSIELAATLLGHGTRRWVKESGGFKRFDLHMLYIWNNTESKVKTIEPTTYTGRIWCPVTKNKSWFARQGGRSFFTGNSAWNIDDNTFRHHIEPQVIACVDALTVGYLRSAMLADGCDPMWVDRIVLWYDPTDLVVHPDRSADAFSLHDKLVLSDEALLKATGFSDSDRPSDDERLLRMLQNERTFPDDVVISLFHKYAPTLDIIATPKEPGVAPDGSVTPAQAPAGLPSALPSGPPAAGPPTAPPAANPPALAASAAPVPNLHLSRRLVDIDRDLRIRLKTLANMAVRQKLSRAGARARTKVVASKDETMKAKINHRPNEQVTSILGPKAVARLGLTSSALVGSDWSDIQPQYQSWTKAAQASALAVAAKLVGITPDSRPYLAAQAAQEQARNSGWDALSSGLDSITADLMYSPDHGDDVPADSIDPDNLVPEGLIRGSLAIAGGESLLSVIDGMMSRSDSQDSAIGQIGTGSIVSDVITSNGGEVHSYTWIHGPTFKAFEPHLNLDGVEFATFDDDKLQNMSGWPEVGYFVAGDHPGCFPAETVVSGPSAATATLRDWQGEMVEVRLASGQLLTATPNHPVLTTHGWIPLGDLDEGDEVIRCLDAEAITGLVPNTYQVPTSIEEVAHSVGVSGSVFSRSVEVAPEDFHGDGTGSEVAVVLTDGDLRDRLDTALGQPSGENLLGLAHPMGGIPLAGLSRSGESVETVGSTSFGLMGSSDPSHPPFGGGLIVDETTGFLYASPLDPSGYQALPDGPPVDSEVARESFLRLTGLVAPDKIIHVERYAFSGQVFNLDTRVGWYLADGILVHNCSCDFMPLWTIPENTDTSGQTDSQGES